MVMLRVELQRYEHSVIQVFAIFFANDATVNSLFTLVPSIKIIYFQNFDILYFWNFGKVGMEILLNV